MIPKEKAKLAKRPVSRERAGSCCICRGLGGSFLEGSTFTTPFEATMRSRVFQTNRYLGALLSLLVVCRCCGTRPAEAAAECQPVAADVSRALVHYAKSTIIPQQTVGEILVTERVLRARGPCNFLVFGLGYDTLLWKTLNHGGRTVFLEESEEWLKQVRANHSGVEAYLVRYSTQLLQQQELLLYSRAERKGDCAPHQDLASSKCRLALTGLPPELYQVEWDVILIDAPQGWFPEAPGRMSAIFSMAVLARSRTSGEYTDVMLHDIDRPAERSYAEEFLCEENRVGGADILWHFRIAPSKKDAFCSSSAGLEHEAGSGTPSQVSEPDQYSHSEL